MCRRLSLCEASFQTVASIHRFSLSRFWSRIVVKCSLCYHVCLSVRPSVCPSVTFNESRLSGSRYRNPIHTIVYDAIFRNLEFRDTPRVHPERVRKREAPLSTAKIEPIIRNISKTVRDRMYVTVTDA